MPSKLLSHAYKTSLLAWILSDIVATFDTCRRIKLLSPYFDVELNAAHFARSCSCQS